MKPNLPSITLLSAFLTVLAGTSASGRQLVQNGGFETGDFTGWTLSGNTGFMSVLTNFTYAHSGTYGAQMGPQGSLGFISQSIPTIPGQSYCLSLWFNRPDGETPNQFTVAWGGANIHNAVNITAVGWTNLLFTNLAVTNSTTVRIGFRNDQSYFGLDDVTVFLSSPVSSSAAYTFSTLTGYPSVGSADGVGDNAQFLAPFGVAVDGSGNVYVADTKNSTIRKITPAGVVTTLAGFAGFPGSANGMGSDARFSSPRGVALDSRGNLYVADSGNATIRMMSPSGTNWTVSTIAGQPGNYGSADGAGTNAQLYVPQGLTVDSATNIYVVDSQENTIRKLTPTGTNWLVSTIAGLAGTYGSTDGSNRMVRFSGPKGVVVDSNTNLYVSDAFNGTIRKIAPSGTNWVATTLAGLAGNFGSADGTGTNAQFGQPVGIALDAAGNLYVSDGSIEANNGNVTIRKITPVGASWVVSTFAGLAGNFGSANGTGTNAQFNEPDGVAVDHAGNVYVADTANDEIRKITSAEVVTTLAGSVPGGNQGSVDGTAGQARFNHPLGAAVDGSGNIYIADSDNNTIRQVTSAGSVSTVVGLAGTGKQGTNDGAGSEARFNTPSAVAVDGAGNVYVADAGSHTIRLITAAGLATTIAGQPGINGPSDGTGGAAQFYGPQGITVDSFGNVYVADSDNNTIRKIRPVGTNWVVTTIAGQPGHFGFADGTNTNTAFNFPLGIAADLAGNIYVADCFNNSLRKLTQVGTNWIVSTIAGLTRQIGSGDGPGATAQFHYPNGLAVDGAGVIYVADAGNSTLRRVTPAGANWVVSTIGGVAGTTGSTDGAGSSALFNFASGIAVDSTGNLYVADTDNNTIRQGVFAQFTDINAVSFTQPPATGQLVVTLLPPEAGGQWRFPWETAWRDSGTAATNLVQGEYLVEFRNTPGYLAIPLPGPLAVTNGATVQFTNLYYPTIIPSDTNTGGSLTVNIGPSPPNGAGWRFLGDTTPFYPPGYSTNLLGGTYLIQFAPVSGFVTPANLSLPVVSGLPTVQVVTYLLASAPPAGVNLPAPVPSNNISNLADYPFGFNGQLQTDVGYGSGVAVETNVVLTAAHMIFNDQTLSFVNQAYWFYQQETGVFTPDPLPARGWYVLSGYAAQRTNDITGGLGPDQSSPQSRNLDVAALYFQSPVANGGYGGCLSSDTTPNQWLSSTGDKLLVGYPVDGSQFGFTDIVPGEMYETGPQPYALGQAADPVADQQVYTASWFLSYPGNSGGPLYVQLNGYYYPAGVYLGSLFNGIVPYASAVRAIDSNVVNLINLAANLGDAGGVGTNYSGGGVITIVPSQSTSRNNPGYLILQLGPPSAVQAGAAWELSGQPAADYSTANPFLQEITTTNALVLQFKPIPGWNLPTNHSVTVIGGLVLTNVATYTVTNPVLTLDLVNGLQISGTSNTSYQIQSNSSLTGSWIPFKTNTLTNFGFNLITNHPRSGFYRALWLTNSP